MQDAKAPLALQQVALQGAQGLQEPQSRPCLAISMLSTGEVAVSSSLGSTAPSMLMSAQLAACKQQLGHSAQRRASWFSLMPQLTQQSSSAQLAPHKGPGSFCCHPAAQQAALDLCSVWQQPATQLAAAACLVCTPGCGGAGAVASSSADASVLAEPGSAAAVVSGMQRRAVSCQQPAVALGDSLAYAVELQVASTAPPSTCRPQTGDCVWHCKCFSCSDWQPDQQLHGPAALSGAAERLIQLWLRRCNGTAQQQGCSHRLGSADSGRGSSPGSIHPAAGGKQASSSLCGLTAGLHGVSSRACGRAQPSNRQSCRSCHSQVPALRAAGHLCSCCQDATHEVSLAALCLVSTQSQATWHYPACQLDIGAIAHCPRQAG